MRDSIARSGAAATRKKDIKQSFGIAPPAGKSDYQSEDRNAEIEVPARGVIIPRCHYKDADQMRASSYLPKDRGLGRREEITKTDRYFDYQFSVFFGRRGEGKVYRFRSARRGGSRTGSAPNRLPRGHEQEPERKD